MRKKKQKYPLLENLTITDIAAEGKALGRVDDKVVFVSGAVVGDIVNVQVSSSRRSYMEGYITEFIEYSPLRVEPFCQYFGECGGCKWQMLPYAEQIKFKEQQVIDQLTRLSDGTPIPAVNPILGSENTIHYRNKLEFTFSSRRWVTKAEVAAGAELKSGGGLGFHIPRMFDKVIDIEKCYLQSELSCEIRNAVRDFTLGKEGFEYYDLRTHEGIMRNLLVRTASTGELMVIVVFAKDFEAERITLLEFLKERFPQITSLCYIINEKLNDSIADQTPHCYNGTPYIMEQMEGLRFRVNPKSFYQTNSAQAYVLYSHTRRMAALTGSEVVYDLYTGAGTIANFVARGASKVVGVEYVEEAIADAKVNSELNGIKNTVFYAGDMKDVLTDSFVAENGKPDVMIVDPPRAGMHTSVVEVILNAEPERIVYVSCNPATQARDIGLLSVKYTVTEVQPVDMFPHTAHVENIALLELKK
ncbi:MAG: 23S rRNA (uracil(1939)-C(5))-methyltransferase RlmD [Rikenellaceae bacterium]